MHHNGQMEQMAPSDIYIDGNRWFRYLVMPEPGPKQSKETLHK